MLRDMPDSISDSSVRRCFECGETLPEGSKRVFCGPPRRCQKAHNNRMVKEGVSLVPLLKAFALGRGGGNSQADPRSREAFRELTRYARDLNDADKAKGRPSALDYYSHLTRDGSQYTDRQRTKR